jgi:O-antigen/teichoic acid export membrane protein
VTVRKHPEGADQLGSGVEEEAMIEAEQRLDVLQTSEAGAKVIRGGLVRGLGYATTIVLGGASSVFLLRHLGVDDFGRYVTVTALIGIIQGITDAGLTLVGSREASLRPPGPERARLLGNLVGLRLLITPIGVAGAALFSVAAGYSSTMVIGTLLAGAGLVLVATQSTMMVPLLVDLRVGVLTAVEVAKQALLLVGIIVLVALGASLLPFFALQIGVGIVLLAVTPLALGAGFRFRPAIDVGTARMLIKETLPMAAAVTMNVIYFRVLVILMSLLATAEATGLFATSFRIFEVIFGIPGLVLSVALPVLSVAGRDDDERLRYGLQRTTEVALIASVLIVLLIEVLAEPLIRLLGGTDYTGAAPILRIQALALVPVFVGQAAQLGLIAVRGQRALAVANGGALALVLALGLILIPLAGGKGAAVAAVIAETVLTLLLLVFLQRARRSTAPRFGFARKVALATALAAPILAAPLDSVPAALCITIVYSAAIYLTGAFPREVIAALTPRLRARG